MLLRPTKAVRAVRSDISSVFTIYGSYRINTRFEVFVYSAHRYLLKRALFTRTLQRLSVRKDHNSLIPSVPLL